MGRLSLDKIITDCLNGVKNAFDEYFENGYGELLNISLQLI